MQTSKINPGKDYALKRNTGLVRFHVTEVVSRKTGDGPAKNELRGYVVEDRRVGPPLEFTVEPQQLLGPYEEQAELVERKRQEDAEQAAQKTAAAEQARLDRLALYQFVGVTPPANTTEFRQLFRVSFSEVDISREGTRAIVDRVRSLHDIKAAAIRLVKEANK